MLSLSLSLSLLPLCSLGPLTGSDVAAVLRRGLPTGDRERQEFEQGEYFPSMGGKGQKGGQPFPPGITGTVCVSVWGQVHAQAATSNRVLAYVMQIL